MELMAKAPSKLAEKLQYVVQVRGVSFADMAWHVGVSPQLIGHYLKGSAPGPVALVAMAEFLNVPIKWLVSDELPIEPIPSELGLIDTEQLMRESASRYTDRYLKITGYLDRAEKIDWETFAQEIQDYSPTQPVYTLPKGSKLLAQLDVLFAIKAHLLQDILDPCDSVNLAFRTSKFSGGKLPVEVDPSANPARMYIFQRIDAIHERALTTKHAQSVFRWALTRAVWSGLDAIFDELDRALKACGV